MNRILRILLRPLWHRRHLILRNVKALFDWIFNMLDKIPLPIRAKLLIHDVFFLSILHLIVHTQRFSKWRSNHSGTGRLQYLLTQQAEDEAEYIPLIPAPTHVMWEDLRKQMQPNGGGIIDVIVPVYSGYEQSLNAIYLAVKTRAQNETAYNVIVIDDASPDAALSATLRQLAKDGLFELHVNAQNLGFVATVNKGMMISQNDVILLNADTEVYNNWLDRMVEAANSDSSIATVTPMSNNAEICSYPYFVQNNQRELEVPYAQLDLMFAELNSGEIVDVPTGVGFCMYISRKSIDDVGLFDVEHFGKGYGEENDFCMRAFAKGWRNVVTCDTFVRHIGGTSFGKSKQKRCKKAYEVLVGLHPHYPKLVREFIADDPIRSARKLVDMARINLANAGQKSILMVSHNLGGGTERNIRELCNGLLGENIGHVVLEPSYLGEGMIALKHFSANNTANLVFSMENDREELIQCLRELKVFHLHVNHLINFPERIVNLLQLISRELELQYDFTVHDYFSICPRINLIDDDSNYCGEPEVQGCEICIQKNHSHAKSAKVWQWRANYEAFLGGARRVFAPDADVAKRINNYYRNIEIVVRTHPEDFDNGVIHRSESPKERLKIGVVGAISGLKGSRIIQNLVEDANERDLAIEYVVIGYTDRSDLSNDLDRFHVTGKYAENEVGELIAHHQPDLIFIPSLWPETYCYTLSIAWRFGLMPVVFDIGAQAARIRSIGKGAGRILPLEFSLDATVLNDWFLANMSEKIPEPKSPANVAYASFMVDYYGLADAKVKAKKVANKVVKSA